MKRKWSLCSSIALYIRTGMLTRPKLIAPDQIARGTYASCLSRRDGKRDGASGLRSGRPGDERLADLPVMAERVFDPPQEPAVLLAHGIDLGRSRLDGAAYRRCRIVDDQQHLHRPAPERLGAEVRVLR